MPPADLSGYVEDLESAGATVYETDESVSILKVYYGGKWDDLRRQVEYEYFCVHERGGVPTSIILQPVR